MTAVAEDLTDELAAYYRRVLLIHHDTTDTGRCAICGVARCPDWVAAYDALAAAGLPMGDPAMFEGPLPPRAAS